MEAELERLQQQGTIEPVQWAAPIVPVVKSDNSMRVCGDYKVTVNRVAKVDKYLSHELKTRLPRCLGEAFHQAGSLSRLSAD